MLLSLQQPFIPIFFFFSVVLDFSFVLAFFPPEFQVSSKIIQAFVAGSLYHKLFFSCCLFQSFPLGSLWLCLSLYIYFTHKYKLRHHTCTLRWTQAPYPFLFRFLVIEKMPWLFATLLKWIRWQNIPEVVHLQQGELKRKTYPSLVLALSVVPSYSPCISLSPSHIHTHTDRESNPVNKADSAIPNVPALSFLCSSPPLQYEWAC